MLNEVNELNIRSHFTHYNKSCNTYIHTHIHTYIQYLMKQPTSAEQIVQNNFDRRRAY